MIYLVIALVVVLVVALVIMLAARRGQPSDDIASFRRQLEALSPEARRPTIERMKPPSKPSADDDGDDG